ncbi:YdcF family protein [Glaciecola sp. MH2013]|uniref:YdcF family protein n=1 Tax=Glaciecola sp. MH2013 TaxID=2785524 RepID=UPI00189E47B2|nr:YdcF family protein [Glaciecola sp. MH2013]MBF7072174.1 YdcF family protein [Glaciecola sp. MH2013]
MINEFAHILVSPINHSLVLIGIFSLLKKFNIIKKMTHRYSVGVLLLWLYLCSQPFFSAWLISSIEKAHPPITIENAAWHSADAIWVLGCGHFNAEGLPSVSKWNNCALQRLVHSAQMYRYKPTKIIVTGGRFGSDKSFSYASKAKAFLVELGVNSNDIIEINQGSNTQEEFYHLQQHPSYQLTEFLAIVSSASHGKRLKALVASNDVKPFIFIPVEHNGLGKISYLPGFPKLGALEESRRAIYVWMANIKLVLNI